LPKFHEQLKDKFDTLTKGERRVATYLCSNYYKAAFMPAAAVGKEAGVSETTVIRLATALGYSGFSQMQSEIRELLSRERTIHKLQQGLSRLGPEEDLLAESFTKDIDNIQSTYRRLDREQFRLVLQAITTAGKVFVMGLRASASLAHYLSYALGLVLGNTHIVRMLDGCHPEELSGLGPGDVFFAIAFPRYSLDTLKAFRWAKRAGATTVALTDSPLSPFARDSDYQLYAVTESPFLLDSFLPAMAVVQAIIAHVWFSRKEGTFDRLKRLETIYADLGIFYSEKES